MKFAAALIASALCLSGLADAKLHKVGLKKIPKEDFTVVYTPPTLNSELLGSYVWSYTTFKAKIYGPRS